MLIRRWTFGVFFIFSACSGSNSNSSCPNQVAVVSHLSVEPAIQPSLPIHPHGKNSTWNWQLTGAINESYDVDVYDIDLFETSSSKIAELQASGKKVICYFSAGSSEEFRDDFQDFNAEDQGKPLDGWEGERWLDIRSQNVLDVMEARLDLALEKKCDGVEPDNVDGYLQDTCFDLTENDQLAYNRAIANMARERGLAVALKNLPDNVSDLVDYYDFAVTEQCFFYNECESYSPFTAQNKPIFNAEYDEKYHKNPDQSELCTYSGENDIQTLVLSLDLNDSYRHSCF